MSPLHVYKASAGSGKTFSLTMEYLKLLFLHPDMHRHILAVTFTNKAAGEMKSRILGRLYALSGAESNTPMEEMVRLAKFTGLDHEAIRKKAGVLLRTILNEYSRFSVGTIDKFFQSVIRAFTREIGIQPGYNLELDHNRVLSLAVERLFQDISEDSELQQWLIRFAEERLEESRSWNFKNDIIGLGGQLFKEAFQGLFLEQDISVLGKSSLDLYFQDLQEVEVQTRQEMLRISRSALEKIDTGGFEVIDFKLKERSVPSLFREASEGHDPDFTDSKLAALDTTEKWLNKSAPEEMLTLTKEVLMPLLNQLYKQQVMMNTLQAIRRNFYTLGILGDIWEQVSAYTRERNLFLIADSSRFLKGIIGGNQVPFIYERTGNRFSHIMLDEFQDTSVFQYDNFKPLLDNALAAGNDNLVVGDVKQSIYRWRNSNWNILATELEQDFRHQEYHVKSLDRNFRSLENVILFNNSVFQAAPRILAKRIEGELIASAVNTEEAHLQVRKFRDAYADAVQQVPENLAGSGGMVRLELFDEQEDFPFRERVLSRIPSWIEELQQNGIEPGEIAILVRSRKEGVSVAGKLLEQARQSGNMHMFRLISNESLLLIHNTSVTLIISALRYMLHPTDQLNNALLKYQCFLSGSIPEPGMDRLFDSEHPMDQSLPEAFSKKILILKQLPLYELVEHLIGIFGLGDRVQDLPYIQALQDLVIDLHRREPQDIYDFLSFWDQHGFKQGISISEESNAIRILTIHKAKGLEFKAVVIPFCNWEITTDQKKSNILWCNTGGTPFKRIPVVPVRYSSQLKHTLFSAAYSRERMKGYMDSLNLMYVAFTRAKDVLIIGIPEPEKRALRHMGDLMNELLDQVPEQAPSLEPLKKYRNDQVIQVGQLPAYQRSQFASDPWKFDSYPVDQRTQSLRIRLRSDEYFVDEEGKFSTGLSFGNTMHQLFSRIITEADVEPLLNEMVKDGLIPQEERTGLHERIIEMIQQPGAEHWFSGSGQRRVYSERNILCGDGRILRPDRVIEEGERITVVDFKFGAVDKEQNLEQVREYLVQMEKMGHPRAEGFVWYVMLRKIIKVEIR